MDIMRSALGFIILGMTVVGGKEGGRGVQKGAMTWEGKGVQTLLGACRALKQ